MTRLCKNRTEGFGPESTLYSGVTTSCFNDVILVPLATWLYFVLVATLFVAYPHTRRHGSYDSPDSKHELSGHGRAGSRRRRRCGLCKDLLYFAALFCAFAMTVLEVVRLELADLGIGLLPFVWPAFLLAGFLRISRGLWGRFTTYWIAGVFLWIALVVMTSVKLAEHVKEGINTRKGTKYPMSDQVIDVAVYLGVFVVLAVAELWR